MCITPMFRKEYQVNVPCGRCPVCVKKRVSSWSVRLLKEAEVSTSALFVTLTYNTDNVPLTNNGWMSLDKSHLQSFFKRLRYYEKETKIKYYAVGEYGSRYNRPHYHIILYNARFENVVKAWTIDGREIGHVHFGQCTSASVGYCLKYISKEKRTKVPNDDRQDIFNVMSKGLGKNYIEDPKNIRFHHSSLDDRYYVPAGNGIKASMPRYYRNKIYDSEQFGYLKGVLERNAKEKEDELHQKYSSWHIAQLHKLQFEKMHINSKKEIL